jgi:2-polyprenyl-3-methyl-5-hydroxy-6-metoxy-1,4-benzoquinol methylase
VQTSFNIYIPLFEKKLRSLDVQSLTMAPYCQRYLNHLLQNSKYYLSIYAEVLEKVKLASNIPVIDMCLLDYGAGNGLLGLFAKFCGFGKVMVNDIDESFLTASEILSKALDIDIHQFILGDVDVIKQQPIPQKIDALVATDLIEHIYDLDEFVSAMESLNPELIFVFTTGSNPENYFKARLLMKLQRRDELIGGNTDDALLFGHEAHESYLKMRENMIRNIAPELDGTSILTLAKLTRGKNRKDIINAVNHYQYKKELPLLIEHATNTCHPETGSWTERLMPISTYKSIFKKHQFYLQVSAGFYNQYQSGFKGICLYLLNKISWIFGFKLAPFIFLTGKNMSN